MYFRALQFSLLDSLPNMQYFSCLSFVRVQNIGFGIADFRRGKAAGTQPPQFYFQDIDTPKYFVL